MSEVRDLVQEAFRIEERGVDWRAAVAGALAVGGPMVVGLAIDDPVAGLIGGLGGLNAALCVPRGGLRTRLWWGGLCTAGIAVAFVLAVERVANSALGIVIGLAIGETAWRLTNGRAQPRLPVGR